MKISKLLAVGALALTCLLGASAIAAAAQVDLSTEPILSYQDIAQPAVCDLAVVNVDAVAIPMAECSSPAPAVRSTSFPAVASLFEPVSVFDLPLLVHFDPGRYTG